MNPQIPENDNEGNVVVSDDEASERCHRWLVANGKACLIEEHGTSNEEVLLEAKDLEGTTDDINCHLYTFWNNVKHAWGLPCDSLEHLEDYRQSSVKPWIFPWRVNGMCPTMRRLLYARWKELELHALSDSFEEERELAASALEQESYEQEMEERTKLFEETNYGVDSMFG